MNWISAVVSAATVILVSSARIEPAAAASASASAIPVSQPTRSAANATDISARHRSHQHSYHHGYRHYRYGAYSPYYSRYYARPYYYEPDPYYAPLPFGFSFGIGPWW
jgi:hypothetical protein